MAVDLCSGEALSGQGQLLKWPLFPFPLAAPFCHRIVHSIYLKPLPGSRSLAEGLGE